MSDRSSSIARECSPFLDGLITRHPQWFKALNDQGRLENHLPPDPVSLESNILEHGLDKGLRSFRNQEMMRIVWRELNRRASLAETMADLSLLAALCLEAALSFHNTLLVKRFGTPRGSDGQAQEMSIIAMGKLGGGELNLSSDIDIIFTFPGTGECDGRRKLSNEEFFTRLARQLVQSLSDVTEDGFCFRVDTRLRPFGESGPLVCSFGAMEQYYQREGRDWERYALVKASAIAGDKTAGEQLLRDLAPFVYRRYIDFGAVEILHEMYRSLREDSARNDRANDIKRGPGGIREIEFLVQTFQLLRGGREPALQTTSLLTALRALENTAILPPEVVQSLAESYNFLRHLENSIQALHDQQTHCVPGGDDLDRVRMAMGFKNTDELHSRLDDVRKSVFDHIEECFPEQDQPVEDRHLVEQWLAIKNSVSNTEHPTKESFKKFIASLSRLSLSSRAAQRLDQFMPGLLGHLDDAEFTEAIVTDVLNLVLAISRRSAYLSLLVQNPSALKRMMSLFKQSHWLARVVIRHPALLDELIDPALGKLLPDKLEVETAVQRIMDSHQDTENALLALNYMKLAFSLRIAVAELETTLSARQVQVSLSQLAEAIIDACYTLALQNVSLKHGVLAASGLAIIAYGSLGAEELSYSSDLDLIFLYESGDDVSNGRRPLEPERYHTMVVRRVLSFLTSSTASGRLYDVDTRLRPNGRSGLLVSSVSAFEKYQKEDAWTWELQALSRARPCAGSMEIGQIFMHLREEILKLERDPDQLRSQVQKMRRRLRKVHKNGGRFKHSDGGLIDIDFIAQLGVLATGSNEALVVAASGTLEQLRALHKAGWLNTDDFQVLTKALAELTHGRHFSLLSRDNIEPVVNMIACRKVCHSYLREEA